MPEDNDVDFSKELFKNKEKNVQTDQTITCPNCEADIPINGKVSGKCPKCGWVDAR